MEIREIVVPEINSSVDLPQVALPQAPPITLDIGVPVIELPHFNPMDMEPEVEPLPVKPAAPRPADPPAAKPPPVKLPKKNHQQQQNQSQKNNHLSSRNHSLNALLRRSRRSRKRLILLERQRLRYQLPWQLLAAEGDQADHTEVGKETSKGTG